MAREKIEVKGEIPYLTVHLPGSPAPGDVTTLYIQPAIDQVAKRMLDLHELGWLVAEDITVWDLGWEGGRHLFTVRAVMDTEEGFRLIGG